MKKINPIAIVLFLQTIIFFSACSKDDPGPNTDVSTIKLRLNDVDLTGDSFRLDGQILFMEFYKENMQLSILTSSIMKGSKQIIEPHSSLKFIVYYRATNKTYIADSTKGSGELYIEQNDVKSESVILTDFFTGERYNAKKRTSKMKGSFRFKGYSTGQDSLTAENGIFEATDISYIR
jgi:hypothetical protein